MEITGRLFEILPTESGESARGPWMRGGFVIETDEMYPKKVAFNMFGEDRIAMTNGIALNTPVTVTFAPESRNYVDKNGKTRWSTDLRCIRVVPAMMQTAAAPAAAAAPATAAAPAPAEPTPFASQPADSDDDLPF